MKNYTRQRLDELIAKSLSSTKSQQVAAKPITPIISKELEINKLNGVNEDENAISRFVTDGNFETIISQVSPSEQSSLQTTETSSPAGAQETSRQSAEINVILNSDQERAWQLISSGKSCCIIGAAGTGKTTAMRIIIQRLRDAGKIAPISTTTKYLSEGMPGVVVMSYTNKAVANIRRGMPKDIACRTIHKLIEFEPEFYEVMNAEGEMQKTMRFEPKRNRYNKLPFISAAVIEEGSTISTYLHNQLMEAMSGSPQFIYMGDIQQLPPVFGDAILGYKMLELPVVELKTVMRQALESPILAFAWEILKGKPLAISDIEKRFNKEEEFKIRPWKKRLSASDALKVTDLLFNGGTDKKGNAIPGFIDSGEYNQLEDMILMPFAKRNIKGSENWMCTDEVNKCIAQKLGKMRGAIIHEIIAGYNKHYYAEGDKVLVNKQEAIVTKISVNGNYVGKTPIDSSPQLNRWGHYEANNKEELDLREETLSQEDIELMLLNASAQEDVEERKNQASHILHCKLLDSDEEVDISTTGEFAETGFAYALTIHKAQGSEWKRVILLLHNSNDKMISRELLYTAVTRARESLYIICEPNHFEKGIERQRIKGNSLEEKAEWFKGRQEKNGNGRVKQLIEEDE